MLVLESKYPRKTEFCIITCVSEMALLKYFKPINRSTSPLSEIVPLSSIEAANKEVESIVSQVEKSSIENDPEGNSPTAKSKTMKRAHT